MGLRFCAGTALAFAMFAGMAGPHVERAAAGPAADRTGDVIVRFRDGTTLAGVGRAVASARVEAAESTAPSRLVLLEPEPGQSVDDAIAALAADPAVEFAEADVRVSAALTPNDSLYASYQWNAPQIGLPTAWDVTTGSASVIIAVVDTGVDATHPELSGRVLTGRNFVANPDNSVTADDHFHGTFVAGVAAAAGNNSAGIAGVCWSCKILPLKVLDSAGNGSTYDVAAAIDWAVANGADVINLSLGSPTPLSALETAVNNAWSAGVVLVAATGNSNGAVMYPAAYPNVIAVGANTSTGERASFSNYGPEIDLVAPGQDVLGTMCNCATYSGGYGFGSGTSFATPHVAGVAGLLIASGTTNNTTIKSLLESTATDGGAAGFDNYYGHGRVNAAAAIGADDDTPPTVSMTAPSDGATINGTVNVTGTASDNVAVTKVDFYVDGVWKAQDTLAPYSFSFDTTTVSDGTRRLSLKAWDAAGNSTTVNHYVTVSNNPDTTPPSVSMTSPADSAVVSGTISVAGTASDNIGVTKVDFYVDGSWKGHDTTAPYSFSFDTTTVSDGTRRLSLKAWDAAGNSATVNNYITVANTPDTTPPSVTMTSPSNGATVSGTINIAANASDNVGVTKVDFYVDGSWKGHDTTAPYSFNFDTTTIGDGTHRITAKARDAAGNWKNADNYVTVANTPDSTPPTVNVTAPAPDATVSGTINITANASDNVVVARVELYVDGTWKAKDLFAPWAFTFDTTTLPNGLHRITVKAFDAAGNWTNGEIWVTVSN